MCNTLCGYFQQDQLQHQQPDQSNSADTGLTQNLDNSSIFSPSPNPSLRRRAREGVYNDYTKHEQLQALETFSKNIGLAFQVQDDILDVTADTEQLGKPSGSDEKLNKSTYVKLMGINQAKEYSKSLFINGTHALSIFGEKTMLIQLASWLWQRQK